MWEQSTDRAKTGETSLGTDFPLITPKTGGSNEREIRTKGCFPGFGAIGGLLPHGGYSPPFGGCGVE